MVIKSTRSWTRPTRSSEQQKSPKPTTYHAKVPVAVSRLNTLLTIHSPSDKPQAACYKNQKKTASLNPKQSEKLQPVFRRPLPLRVLPETSTSQATQEVLRLLNNWRNTDARTSGNGHAFLFDLIFFGENLLSHSLRGSAEVARSPENYKNGAMSNPSEHKPGDYPLIDENAVNVIKDILRGMQLCDDTDTIASVSKAGEGNMNVVLRVHIADKSLIVKQSRPWVAKYPSIEAPEERIVAELDFYQRVKEADEVTAALPKLLGFDIDLRTIVMEDLGAAMDYLSLYEVNDDLEESNAVFEQAIHWLSHLHQVPLNLSDGACVGCDKLKDLNHAHMFVIPLQSDSIDLDSVCQGLQHESNFIREDHELHAAIGALGKQYLSDGQSLLHGDYYPGSWLKTAAGFRVIDPEFCFAGPVEFDLGVLAAHWIFCDATSDRSTIDRVCKAYGESSADARLVAKFAGVELIRRLMGVAQLPLDADLNQRLQWLKAGRALVMDC